MKELKCLILQGTSIKDLTSSTSLEKAEMLKCNVVLPKLAFHYRFIPESHIALELKTSRNIISNGSEHEKECRLANTILELWAFYTFIDFENTNNTKDHIILKQIWDIIRQSFNIFSKKCNAFPSKMSASSSSSPSSSKSFDVLIDELMTSHQKYLMDMKLNEETISKKIEVYQEQQQRIQDDMDESQDKLKQIATREKLIRQKQEGVVDSVLRDAKIYEQKWKYIMSSKDNLKQKDVTSSKFVGFV